MQTDCKHGKWRLLLASVFTIIVGAACGGSEGGNRVVEEFVMEGYSMDPTIPPGTVVKVLGYGDARAEDGDIIAFLLPPKLYPAGRKSVKRIIAGPGDKLEIKNQQVRLNGNILNEPYAKGVTGGIGGMETCGELCSITLVDENTPGAEQQCNSRRACYFVLGDNRMNSVDSRVGWLVSFENILGWVAAK